MLTRCVYISNDGIVRDISVDIDKNEHGILLGGKITFVGQIEHSVYGPIVFMTRSKASHSSNPHKLPFPLQKEVVYGPIICMRIDGGKEQHFTSNAYLELF